jgi:hypothetical protein
MVHKTKKYFIGEVVFPKKYGGRQKAKFSIREAKMFGEKAKVFDLVSLK